MKNKKRTNLISGFVLILLGLGLLSYQIFPNINTWATQTFTWPVTVIIAGFGLLVIGLLSATPDMAVPACIVSGIGGILYWQDITQDWGSWSYIWTLIPGFAGAGTLISGLIQGKRKDILDGLQAILTSVVMFIVFGALLGNLFTDTPLAQYWPVLLIGAGIFMFIRALLNPKKEY